MAVIEFEVGEQSYRAGKLSAMQQFHLTRKLAPVLPKLIPIFVQLAASSESASEFGVDQLALLASDLSPAAEVMAHMSEADSEYIISTCLSVVQRQQGNIWTSIWNASVKLPQFNDIELPQMLQMTWRVLQENLGSFFPAQPTSPTTEIPAA